MSLLPIVLLVLIWLWPGVWYRFVKNKLELEVHILREQVQIGDPVPLHVTIRNRSWLPCPYVEFSLLLPHGLKASETGEAGDEMLRFRTFLLFRQETRIELACFASGRGPQRLHEAVLTLNEGFGIRTLTQYIVIDKRIFVIPNFSDTSQTSLPMQDIMGSIEMTRWLFPDEALLKGIRQYQRGDSFKHIAWLASARSGNWMTKEFSTSTDAKICLVLNAQFQEQYWEKVPEKQFDDLCAFAATVSYQISKKGFPIEFASNAVFEKYPKTQWFGEQLSEGIRSLLGKAHAVTSCPLDKILQRLAMKSLQRNMLLLITDFLTHEQVKIVRHLAKSGLYIMIITDVHSELRLPPLKNVHMIQYRPIEVRSELRTDAS